MFHDTYFSIKSLSMGAEANPGGKAIAPIKPKKVTSF